MKKSTIVSYTLIFLGCILMSLGLIAFLVPSRIATGGTVGLAIVLSQAFGLHVSTWIALINVPLLLLGFRMLGSGFFIKSIVCLMLLSFLVELGTTLIAIPTFSSNQMLATLYGGICVGAGLGLALKAGASAGGASIMAKILAEKNIIKESTFLLLLDGTVVFCAGLLANNIELALWSLISIYVTTRVIDVILIGLPHQKIVHISSIRNLEELSKLIDDQLNISGTIVIGNDLGINEYKHIIFLMVDKNKLSALKKLVSTYDSTIKMIIMEAKEVL